FPYRQFDRRCTHWSLVGADTDRSNRLLSVESDFHAAHFPDSERLEAGDYRSYSRHYRGARTATSVISRRLDVCLIITADWGFHHCATAVERHYRDYWLNRISFTIVAIGRFHQWIHPKAHEQKGQ